MKKQILSLVLALFTLTGFAQTPQQSSVFDRIFIGGGIGGQFGSNYTYVNVSPSIGYWITNSWSAGAGFTYQYFQDKIFNYSTSILGPTAFTRYHFLRYLFATAEFEYLFRKYKEEATSVVEKVTAPVLLLGGGAYYSLGGAVSAYIMVLVDVIENQYSPYRNPVIRFGVNVGL